MKTLSILAALGLAAASLSPAAAQVDQRRDNQQRRIEQGVRSGELTGHEARKLERQQGRIDRTETRMRYRDGGHLTPGQRARLQHRENHASGAIYRHKHNAQVR